MACLKELLEKSNHKQLLAYAQSPDRRVERMNAALKAKVEEIQQWFTRECKRSLESRYKLGLLVKPLYDDETEHGSKRYGERAIETLRLALKWQEDLIPSTLRLVRSYSPAEFKQLTELRNEAGKPLTWSHVRILVQVGDPSKREDLLQRTLRENWTSDQLTYEYKRLVKQDRPTKRGRSLVRPKDLDGVVRQQATLADEFLERAQKVWRVSDDSLTRHYQELAPSEHTVERAQMLKDHATRLRRLAQEAEERAQEAEVVYEHFLRVMESHQGSDGRISDRNTGLATDEADQSSGARVEELELVLADR
jgi:hypothetical protein